MNEEKRRFWDAIWIPAAAVFWVVFCAVGLGAIFTTIFVNTPLKEWGVIALGLILVVAVPLIAYLLERKTSE